MYDFATKKLNQAGKTEKFLSTVQKNTLLVIKNSIIYGS